MRIYNEVQQLEELAVIGKALVRYATGIEPGLVFQRQDGWWVPPVEKNFVAFQFRWSDSLSITLNLYGDPDEQFSQNDLILKRSRFNYSRGRLTDETQLMAATVCIWRAHQLFHRERHTETGSLILVDDLKTLLDEWAWQPVRPVDGRAHQSPVETLEWRDGTDDFNLRENLPDPSLAE